MLLTIATTHTPATDLGYLLHKHPERMHEFELPYGRVDVFYPEATDDRCTAALLLEVDPLQIAHCSVHFSCRPSPLPGFTKLPRKQPKNSSSEALRVRAGGVCTW